MKSIFQILAPELRRAGFRKSWGGQCANCKVVEYERVNPDSRKLDVQIWATGDCRVSHWIGGLMDTPPTDFSTVEEMHAAIAHESTRTDNKRYVAAAATTGDSSHGQ